MARYFISLGIVLGIAGGIYAAFFHTAPVDFSTEVKPLLNKKCLSCHGGVKKSGGVSFLFPEEALETGESGNPTIVPGDAHASEMIARIKSQDPDMQMPPEGPRLTDEEVELLEKWIEQGAKWGKHWAYEPLKPVELPQPKRGFWAGFFGWDEQQTAAPSHPIDQFVHATLQQEKLDFSPQADCATLLRRVYLDLTGLPPTPEAVDRFCADPSDEAYAQVVDSLLASPAYGERWAGVWMDLARYADSKGYERDPHRSIWRYRDWLIQAFNQDMPFDRFTIEQLAGDLLPNPTDEQLIATAYHRNTMNNDEGGTDDEEFRVAAQLDRVNTTWDVWMGTTFACVQCHSHPYDPFRHEEYYQFMAFFNNTGDEDMPGDYPLIRELDSAQHRQQLAELADWMAAQTPEQPAEKVKRQWVDLVKLTEPKIYPHSFDSITKGALADGKYLTVEKDGFARLRRVPFRPKQQLLLNVEKVQPGGSIEFRLHRPDGPLLGTLRLPDHPDWGFRPVVAPFALPETTADLFLVFRGRDHRSRVCAIEWLMLMPQFPDTPETPRYQARFLELLKAPATSTPILLDRPEGLARTTHIFERGSWLTQGKPVQPGTPGSMLPLPEGAPRNRLGLAQWLTHPDHPLTARVAVNRFWEQLFGIGLVETVEDFGSQGFTPSHPQLLDWLAWQLIHEYRWSVKQLLRTVVTSGTYRQSSVVNAELLEKDPANRLLARGPRFRLSAEQVRDQSLAVSGLLSGKMYGPSVMPHQPEGIWQVVYNGMGWKTAEGDDAYRRALYTYWRRTSPYPSMITFDAPSREFCLPRRIRTNTPLQALTTLNDTVQVLAARQLAQRMATTATTPDEQVRAGYRWAMGKWPTPEKAAVLAQLYREALQYYQDHPAEKYYFTGKKSESPDKVVSAEESEGLRQLAALTTVANTLLNLDEFLTKE